MIEKPARTTIWKREIDADTLNRLSSECMVSHVGIEFTEIGANYLCARMPVDARTMQPFGQLHGGASVVLSETLGSAAAICCVDETKICVGIEINANHVRAAKRGWVKGEARPVHLGRTIQIWETRITDEDGQLVSTGRMTLAVLDRP